MTGEFDEVNLMNLIIMVSQGNEYYINHGEHYAKDGRGLL